MTSASDLWDLVVLFRASLATAAAVGAASGVAGTLVLLRRESLVALALPQAVAVGAAIGFRLGAVALPAALAVPLSAVGWPTLPCAAVVTALVVVLLAAGRQKGGELCLLPSIYVGGLCLSLLVVAGSGEHLNELQNRFVGIDVAVSDETARLTVPLALSAGAAIALLWRRWLLIAQAPGSAELAGLRPHRWNAAFLSLLAAVVLLGSNALGIAMVLALLFLPAAAALPWSRRVPTAMAFAAVLALMFLAAGFVLSNVQNWPFSQSVGAAGFVAVIASHALARVTRSRG